MGPMRGEINAALAGAAPADKDAGAVALLRQYADLIDAPGVPGKYTEALDWLMVAAAKDENPKADGYAQKILLALSLQTTVSDIGPKMLAAMEALQLTPRARKAATTDDRNGAASPLDELRDKRRRRAGNVL